MVQAAMACVIVREALTLAFADMFTRMAGLFVPTLTKVPFASRFRGSPCAGRKSLARSIACR